MVGSCWHATLQHDVHSRGSAIRRPNHSELTQPASPNPFSSPPTRYDHIHPDWHASDRGEAALWQSQPYPECHQHLYDYRDIGPMPDAIPWKALVNPDQVACFHTHHGLVLDASWPAAHSTLLEPHLGEATGPDREVEGRECAFFIHFVNLFRVRRHLEEVPREQQRRPWPHVAWLVNACVEESKRDVDWAVAAQQQVRMRKLEGVVEPQQDE